MFIFCLFVSLFTYGQEYQTGYLEKYALKINQHKQVTLDAYTSKKQISYQKIKNASINSYEEFLDYLSSQSPEMFTSPVLVHTSGSLQFSSFHRPRAILFGDNMMLSFSEDPSTEDRRVEIMDFDEKTYQFSLKEIIFSKNQKPKFRENPTECLSCHGQPVRPLWEAYDFWPNVYGSRDGMFLSTEERLTFDEIEKAEGIYKYLKIDADSIRHGNESFTVYVSQMNFLRWFQQIKPTLRGQLYPYRYYLLALMSCHQGYGVALKDRIRYEEYIPKHLIEAFPNKFSSYLDDDIKVNKQTKEYLAVMYHNIFKQLPQTSLELDRLRDSEIPFGSQIEWLFSNHGVYFRDSLMSMRQDNRIHSTPLSFQIDLQKIMVHFFPELVDELDPEVGNIGGSGLKYFDFDCDQLKERSQQELASISYDAQPLSFQSAKTTTAERPVYGKCLSCHSVNHQAEFAPYIPFDQTTKLRAQLRNGLYEKILNRLNRQDQYRMPKGLPMSDLEKESLMKALDVIRE